MAGSFHYGQFPPIKEQSRPKRHQLNFPPSLMLCINYKKISHKHTHTHTLANEGPGNFIIVRGTCRWRTGAQGHSSASCLSQDQIVVVIISFFFAVFVLGVDCGVLNVTRHCSQTKSQQNTTGTKKKTEHKQNTNKNYQAIYLIFFPVFGFLVKNGLVFFFFLSC